MSSGKEVGSEEAEGRAEMMGMGKGEDEVWEKTEANRPRKNIVHKHL